MRSEEQLKEMIHECWDSLEVKKCISRGNFGVVFRCTGGGKAYARDLAVKVVERDFGEDDRINAEDAGLSFDEYFQKKENAARQEIALMVEGQGSHIMPVHNYAIKEEPDKSAFYVLIVMEKMDDDIRKTARNAALWQNPDRTKKPETQGWRDAEAYAVRLANHILTALTVLQNRKDPILHRDIKPANLFLRKIDPAKEDGGCENYDFYLGDFGIARILDDMVTNVTTAGTQVYMAPELIRGKADESSDLYSLGIILYQIVNHWRTPFMSGTGAKENIQQEAYVRRMQAEEIPAPDGCSPEFAKFILKLCRYDPEDRYANAQEALNALNRIIYGGAGKLQDSREENHKTDTGKAPEKDQSLVAFHSFENTQQDDSPDFEGREDQAANYSDDILWQEEGSHKGRKIEAAMITAAVIAAAAVLLFSAHWNSERNNAEQAALAVSGKTAGAVADSIETSGDESTALAPSLASADVTALATSGDTTEENIGANDDVTEISDMEVTGNGSYEDAEDVRNTLGIQYREAYIHQGDNLTFKLDKEYVRFIAYVSCYDWAGDDTMLYVYLDDSNDPVYQLNIRHDMEPTLVDIDLKGADSVTLYLDVGGNYINSALLYKAAFYKTDEAAEEFLAREKKEAEKPANAETTALEDMPFIQGKVGASEVSDIYPVTDEKDINGKIYREALELDGDYNTYYVNREFKRFVAEWMCEDLGDNGAELNIFLDDSDTPVYSNPMTEDMAPALIDVDISNAKFISIGLDVHGNYISNALMTNAYLYATDEEADEAVKKLGGNE